MSIQKDDPSHKNPSKNLFRLDIRYCLLRLLQGFVACFVGSIVAISLVALSLSVFAKTSMPPEGNSDLLMGGLLFAGYGSLFGMWIPAGLYWATSSYRVAFVAACFVGAFTGAVFFPFVHEVIRSAG